MPTDLLGTICGSGACLQSLCSATQVLETSNGETKGTLLSTVNMCATPAGRRKLKDWVCQPLGRVSSPLFIVELVLHAFRHLPWVQRAVK